MKKILLVLFPIVLCAQSYINTITVQATSTVYVEANVIKFRIRLQQENSKPKLAFEEHKKLETSLIKLLSEYDIPDSAITYSLLNIRKRMNSQKTEVFRTNQEVIVRLNDIKDYTDFQISLLDNGFYEFDAVFTSNKFSGIKEKGYEEALKLAKEDGTALAEAMDKKLGEVLEINIRANEHPYVESNRGAAVYMLVKSSDKDLTEIEQSVEVTTRIEVKFSIVEK